MESFFSPTDLLKMTGGGDASPSGSAPASRYSKSAIFSFRKFSNILFKEAPLTFA